MSRNVRDQRHGHRNWTGYQTGRKSQLKWYRQFANRAMRRRRHQLAADAEFDPRHRNRAHWDTT